MVHGRAAGATKLTLAQAYVFKATKRLRALQVLLDEDSFGCGREAQELVELALCRGRPQLVQEGI